MCITEVRLAPHEGDARLTHEGFNTLSELRSDVLLALYGFGQCAPVSPRCVVTKRLGGYASAVQTSSSSVGIFDDGDLKSVLGGIVGRPVSAKRKVGMNFDMGFAYLGGLNLITYSYYNDANNPEVIKLDAEWIDKNILSDPGISADGRKTANQAKDYLSDADKMPYALLTKFYPVLKLTLFVRLF